MYVCMCVCVCVCMYVRCVFMYVCMCACMYVCMYACALACVYACYVRMYVCMHVRVRACVYASECLLIGNFQLDFHASRMRPCQIHPGCSDVWNCVCIMQTCFDQDLAEAWFHSVEIGPRCFRNRADKKWRTLCCDSGDNGEGAVASRPDVDVVLRCRCLLLSTDGQLFVALLRSGLTRAFTLLLPLLFVPLRVVCVLTTSLHFRCRLL